MKTAADVMDRTFFHASPSDSIGLLLHEMAERGLGCIPVLDATGRPRGVATTGEIEPCYDVDELIERLGRPAVCMDQHTPIDLAARELAQHPSCCLVLVDDRGVAMGTLSPLELLGTVLGVEHGRASLHERDMAWDDADFLELGAAHRVPEAPGIILLSPGVDESRKRLIWAESVGNMRERLDQMLREPQDEEGLESMLEAYPRSVRFRCLAMESESQRERLADALCNIRRTSTRPAPASAEAEAFPRSAVVATGMSALAPVDS
ncbi:MAG TPA: CBS domain-containing protein [Polyangiaceae bacterium]|nr:CBS domain-containing protein [Polyangiaceae bacterium]